MIEKYEGLCENPGGDGSISVGLEEVTRRDRTIMVVDFSGAGLRHLSGTNVPTT